MKKFKVTPSQYAKVENPLPVPSICPNCGGAVELVNNCEIYGREYGDWPFAYRCLEKTCNSYVGLHPKTDIPLGTLANKETRVARSQAKQMFLSVWEVNSLDSKNSAYRWLAEKIGIDPPQCHFGWFGIPQCNRVIEVCKPFVKEVKNV